MDRNKSRGIFEKAKKRIPGGVNSPVRAFNAVGGAPIFIERSSGSRLYDADGNEYIDFIGSWGPAILGHSNPEVINALTEAIPKGLSFGMSSELEYELAKMVSEHVPTAEMIRFVNSGTEATMTAIRLARGYTARDKMIKFEGCYHGHSDGLLVKAGSGGATFGVPTSPGVPADYTKNTIVVPYNDIQAVEDVFSKDEIACVILEPITGNMGVILPDEEFLPSLRDLCTKTGALLIFDEVMTGFRVHEQGVQGLFDVKPDLLCLGKVIGGGMPVGAVAGKKEIMSRLSPLGDIYQAGTLAGNPIAMTAGLKTLEIFYRDSVMEKITSLGKRLNEGLDELTGSFNEVSYTVVGGMFTLFFSSVRPRNFQDVLKCDLGKFGKFFNHMLDNKILLPPSQFEANFISSAHTTEDIEKYLETTLEFLKQ